MKSCLLTVLLAISGASISAADIPASILNGTVTEADWRSLYDNLSAEVAKWHTPTHEPDLVERFWDPLFYLKPNYYFIDGQNLGEIEICRGTWFATYRGKRVSDLVAIGRSNQDTYRKKPLSMADAVRLCLEAHWKCDCHAFLAIEVGFQEVSFPGLNREQVDSWAAADYKVLFGHAQVYVDDDRGTEAKRRAKVLRFAELYNAALVEKLANQAREATATAVTPAAEQPSRQP